MIEKNLSIFQLKIIPQVLLVHPNIHRIFLSEHVDNYRLQKPANRGREQVNRFGMYREDLYSKTTSEGIYELFKMCYAGSLSFSFFLSVI